MAQLRPPFSPLFDEGPSVQVLGSTRAWVQAPRFESQREEIAVRRFLDWLVLGTKTAMTRAELGGALYLAAVIGVLLTARKEEGGR